jgi:hypothetical protein
MKSSYDPFVGNGIFYNAILFLTLNRSRAVTWLLVVQQLILKFTQYTIKQLILTISEQQSANSMTYTLLSIVHGRAVQC